MSDIQVVPATAERWADLEGLFGKNGANAGCWCMWWRMERADFKKLKGDGTKAALHDMLLTDDVPGVLAYQDGQAVGWCAIGPREDFKALENSRILKRVDNQPVWSIVCFFVLKTHRQQGVTAALVQGTVEYAVSQGAKLIESYPIDLQHPQLSGQKFSGYSGYMGIASVFRSLGFVEVGRASDTQLIMRRACP